jgi:3D (Asp-Asp-Asp) domain-containing protein
MKRIITLLLFALYGVSCQSIQKSESKDSKTVKIRTTSYTSKEKDHLKYKKLSATGQRLKEGTCATSWDQFPVGTKIKIENKVYTVDDYGSAMVFSKRETPTIDIYKSTRKEMNKWGVKEFENAEIVQVGDYQRSLDILKDRLKYPQCREMYNRILKKI